MIKKRSSKNTETFLDDFFLLFMGTTKNLHSLFEEANKINPTIQFTMSHSSPAQEAIEDQCECETKSEIPFLDTLASLKNGKLDTDLYKKKKETDRNQYILPSSCHVKQTTTAIPYSLSLRIVRTCSDQTNREKRFIQLKNNLLDRGYSRALVESSIEKARMVPREIALKKYTEKRNRKRAPYLQ